MAGMDWTAVVIVFFVVLMPVMLGFGIAAWAMVMKQRQLQLVLKERELLIEKGITDLPPLEVSLAEKKRNGYGNLKWGLILVAVGAASAGLRFFSFPLDAGGHWMLDLGALSMAVGLALIAFHFIARAYQRQDAETERATAAGKDRA